MNIDELSVSDRVMIVVMVLMWFAVIVIGFKHAGAGLIGLIMAGIWSSEVLNDMKERHERDEP